MPALSVMLLICLHNSELNNASGFIQPDARKLGQAYVFPLILHYSELVSLVWSFTHLLCLERVW